MARGRGAGTVISGGGGTGGGTAVSVTSATIGANRHLVFGLSDGSSIDVGIVDGANGTNGANGSNGVGVPTGGSTGQALTKNSNTDYDTGWTTISGGGSSTVIGLLVGDKSDGNVTLDGTTTPAMFTKSGNVYTLNRVAYFDTLTINAGQTLFANGYPVYARSISNAGIISASGGTGTTTVEGARGSGTGPFGLGGIGGTSTAGNGGVGGSPSGFNLGTKGNYGGSGGANSGGAGPNVNVLVGNEALRFSPALAVGQVARASGTSQLSGGTGGGAGAGDGTNRGGCGGGGGGVLILVAKTIVNNGTIAANGGNGGPAGGGNASGGGGGGAGAIIALSDSVATGSGVWQTNPGTGGAKAGTGQVGYDGFPTSGTEQIKIAVAA